MHIINISKYFTNMLDSLDLKFLFNVYHSAYQTLSKTNFIFINSSPSDKIKQTIDKLSERHLMREVERCE